MSKAKTRAAPGPGSRIGAGRVRDEAGRFIKGVSGNPEGTKHLSPEMKQFARDRSLKGMKRLDTILDNPDSQPKDVIAVVRLFLEYGYGRPAAEYDRERLEFDREKHRDEMEHKHDEDKEQVVKVVFENAELTPEELAELAR